MKGRGNKVNTESDSRAPKNRWTEERTTKVTKCGLESTRRVYMHVESKL